MRVTSLIATAACAQLFVACAPTTTAPTPDASTIPTLTFVDNTTGQPLTDGAPAQIIHGPQGGYHVLVSLAASGIWPGTENVPGSPDDPTTTLRAYAPDGTELTLMTDAIDVFHIAYAPINDTTVTLTSRQLRLALSTPAQAAMTGNELLLLHADIQDRDGRVASDEKHALAIAPTD